MLTQSPKISFSSIMMSPTCMPIRNAILASLAWPLFCAAIARWTSTALRAASTEFANSASMLSPDVFTIRPRWDAMAGATRLSRIVLSRVTTASSSARITRPEPPTAPASPAARRRSTRSPVKKPPTLLSRRLYQSLPVVGPLSCRCSHVGSRNLPPGDLGIEPCGEVVAHFDHRQANLGAVDQAGARQPILGRRRARLGKQQPREGGHAFPTLARVIGSAFPEKLAYRSKRYCLDVGREQDRAVGAIAQRIEIQRILAGQDTKAGGPAPQQLDRLGAVGAAVLHADDVGVIGEFKQRAGLKRDRRAVGDVVKHDRPGGMVGKRSKVLREAALRGARVIGARDQITADRPAGRLIQR